MEVKVAIRNQLSLRRRAPFAIWILLVTAFAIHSDYIGTVLQLTSPELQESHKDLPYFFHAYFFFIGISTVFHAAMLTVGLDLLGGGTGWKPLMKFLGGFYLLFIMVTGFAWLAPDKIGLSIAAASGVGSGTLMIYVICVYPWAWLKFRTPKEDRLLASGVTVNPCQSG